MRLRSLALTVVEVTEPDDEHVSVPSWELAPEQSVARSPAEQWRSVMGDLAPSLVVVDEMTDDEAASEDARARRRPVPVAAPAKVTDPGQRVTDPGQHVTDPGQHVTEPSQHITDLGQPVRVAAAVESGRRRSMNTSVAPLRRRLRRTEAAPSAADRAGASAAGSDRAAPTVAPRRRSTRVAEPGTGWAKRSFVLDRVVGWTSGSQRRLERRGDVDRQTSSPVDRRAAEPQLTNDARPSGQAVGPLSDARTTVATPVERSMTRSVHRITAPIEPTTNHIAVAPPAARASAAVAREQPRVRAVEAPQSPDVSRPSRPASAPPPIRLRVPAPITTAFPAGSAASTSTASTTGIIDEEPVWPTLPPSTLDTHGQPTATRLASAVSATSATTTDFSARWAAELER